MATKTITAARPLRPGLSLSGLAERILAFDSLWRQRRALAALDSTRLEDLGICAKTALNEAKKPIWDAPNSWRR
jgi:uncharacterized protein YjiS (DUF1127 family)